MNTDAAEADDAPEALTAFIVNEYVDPLVVENKHELDVEVNTDVQYVYATNQLRQAN